MGVESPQAKIYKEIPVPRDEVAKGGIFRILEIPGLAVDYVFISPEEGRSCVGLTVWIPDKKQIPKEYGTHINEFDLNMIGSKLKDVTVKDPNSPMGRIIGIYTAASEALNKEKERQERQTSTSL